MANASLIERVEAAVGPDREMDCEIHISIGGAGKGAKPSIIGFCVGSPEDDQPVPAPRYTASIDVALTLVPEGWHVDLRGVNDSWTVNLTHTPYAALGSVGAFSCRAALAIVAASLRARALKGEPE